MPETALSFGQLLWGTIILRPYVFVFLSVYLWLATWRLGLGRTVIYLLVGYGVAWVSEVSSIRTGVPYGLYFYIPATQTQELWVGGVPFMDSLSYVFLTFASYSLALVLTAARQGQAAGKATENRSVFPVFLATILFVTLDVIIDPLALRGYRWFLGQIYGYAEPGLYFGIPLSNFAGWFVVGIIMITFLQCLDHWPQPPSWLTWGQRQTASTELLGAGLYLGIMLFNLGLTFYIGEMILGLVGVLITGTVAVLTSISWKQQRQPMTRRGDLLWQ